MDCRLLVVLVLGAVLREAGSSSCPIGCWCNADDHFVECTTLMKFPQDLSVDTLRLKLDQANAFIPAKGFSYLRNISVIEITNSNIQYIQGCAFIGLKNLREIKIDKSVIGLIDKYAFYGLTGLKKITFEKCNIGKLLPFSFMDVTSIDSLLFSEVHFKIWYPQAFYNLTNINQLVIRKSNVSDMPTDAFDRLGPVTSFTMINTAFWNLHCGVMETVNNASKNLIFTDNTFYCNCSVAWLLNDESRRAYEHVLKDSKCHGPGDLNTTANMYAVKFEALECTKDVPKGKPLPCDLEKQVPRPTCPIPGTIPGPAVEVTTPKAGEGGNGGLGTVAYTVTVILAAGLVRLVT